MSKYNKLRIRTLKVFAFAPGAWFKPGEVADRLEFCTTAGCVDIPKKAVEIWITREAYL